MKYISEEDFAKLLAVIEQKEKDRAEKMPDEEAALKQMFEAYTRLKEMGWNDAIYCPKDGAMFSSISAGSTGIHKCNYTGEWPNGSWWVYDGDVWPSHPILWRPRKEGDPEIDLGLAMDYKCCDHQPPEDIDMTKHADKIAALRADEEGKEIQYKVIGREDWSTAIPTWNFRKVEYREKPFEPEVGKVYAFSDTKNDPNPLIRRFRHMDGDRYVQAEFNLAWRYCRPLTEDEIGK